MKAKHRKLIWVEGEHGVASGRKRSMIVVGHGPDLTVTTRSPVISYPLGADCKRQCFHAVSNALQKLGWSAVAFQCCKMAAGCADAAILVDQAPPGREQWLAMSEPIKATRRRPAALVPKQRNFVARRGAAVRPSRLTSAADPTRTADPHVEARVNEGGALNGATG